MPDKKPKKTDPLPGDRFTWKPEDLPGVTVEKAPKFEFPVRPRK